MSTRSVSSRAEPVSGPLGTTVIMVDTDLRLMHAEGPALGERGYVPEQVIGRLLSEVVPTEAFAQLEGIYRQALLGRSVALDYESPVGSGTFRLLVRPMRDFAGSVTGALGLTEERPSDPEVTARERANGARRGALLTRANELLASAAHNAQQTAQDMAQALAEALGDSCVVRLTEPGRAEASTVSHRDPAGPPVPAPPPSYELQVSIRGHDRVIGTVSMTRGPAGPDYDQRDRELVQLVADRMGLLVEMAQAQEQALREHLERLRLSSQLEAVLAERTALLAQVGAVEAQEQQRIAEAIHDGPIQLVVSAMLTLDTLRRDQSRITTQSLNGAAQALETSVAQLRGLLSTLVRPDLSEGLGTSIASLCRVFLADRQVRWHVSGGSDIGLDRTIEVAVHRILREGLLRAVRQTGLRTLDVAFRRADTMLLVTIQADGSPLTQQEQSLTWLDLATMRARTEAIHGSLRVSSSACGSTMELSVPCGGGELP